MKKFIIAFIFMLTGICQASFLTTPIQVGPNGEDDLVLAPIGALEFNPSRPNNYGLALSESIGLVHLSPVDTNHVAVSPYFFIGAFAAANIGSWVETNGTSPISVDYGLMFGLPKLDVTLPEVAFSVSWNSLDRGSSKMLVDAVFPVDILSNILVHKL